MGYDLLRGKWHKVANEQEFKNLLTYGNLAGDNATGEKVDIHKGTYDKTVNNYYLVEYSTRCPRNCCWDLVRRLFAPEEVVFEVRREIEKWANLLKEARGK